MLKNSPRYTVAGPKAELHQEECKTDKWKKFVDEIYIFLSLFLVRLANLAIKTIRGISLAKNSESPKTTQAKHTNKAKLKTELTVEKIENYVPQPMPKSMFFSLFFCYLFVSPQPTQLTSENTLNMENILCGSVLRIRSSHQRCKKVQLNRA